MKLFTRKRWVGDVQKESRHFYAWLRGLDGVRRLVKLSTDRRASEMMLMDFRRKVELGKVGVVNRYGEHEKRPLIEHLQEYGAYLEGKGDTERHVRETVSKCRRVLDGCGFEFVSDLSASRLQDWLTRLRHQGLSPTTRNHYLRAVKGFAAWLVQDGRTAERPLAYLKAVNVEGDVRLERRALSGDEARRLVEAADAGPVVVRMSGPLRALCYRLVLATGLRANEVRSLTWQDLALGDEPAVTVQAAYSKHRRRDVLPLAPNVAEALGEWRRQHPFDVVVFPLPQRTAKMLRVDLEAADIPYRDAAGRVADFHALRHTFITNLVRGGVHAKVAQTLARHSTITLTLDRYTHLEVLEQRSALDVLPDLSPSAGREEVKVTGTDA